MFSIYKGTGLLLGLLMGKHAIALFVAQFSYVFPKLYSSGRVRVTLLHTTELDLMVFTKFRVSLCYFCTWVRDILLRGRCAPIPFSFFQIRSSSWSSSGADFNPPQSAVQESTPGAQSTWWISCTIWSSYVCHFFQHTLIVTIDIGYRGYPCAPPGQ